MENLVKNNLGQWSLQKSGGEDITFKHKEHTHLPQTGKDGERPIGAMDHHSFDVYHKGNHIGTANALHESDDIHPTGIDVSGRHPNEVKQAFKRHLNGNWKKYTSMSPTYGK